MSLTTQARASAPGRHEYKLTARERAEAIASAEAMVADLKRQQAERNARRAEAESATHRKSA